MITNTTQTTTAPSIVTLPPGTLVEVETEAYGMQLATVAWTRISPYYHETKLGIYRTFVVSLPGAPAFTDYILPENLKPALSNTCTGCERELHECQLCPECGLCLSDCCVCPPPFSPEDGEDSEYDRFEDEADRRYDAMMDTKAERENR